VAAKLAFDRELLHELLLAAPIDVLCFDEKLVCRYAAPAGGRFLGRAPAELQGRPLAALFPQLGMLVEAAPGVLASGGPRRFEHVALGAEAAPNDEPWTLRLQRCLPKHPRSGEGASTLLLLTCLRCACPDRCCPARAVPADDAGAIELWRNTSLPERVRTKLTVISGFAQLLQRRSRSLPSRVQADVEHINAAARELSELIERYEAAGADAGPGLGRSSDALVSARPDARSGGGGRRDEETTA
jgi:PAS domain-containing protein